MRRYPEYKDSGIEWLGEIPEHWNVKRLKFITRINPSKTEDNIVKNSTELVTFLPMENVNSDGTYKVGDKKSIKDLWNGSTFFAQNDIIMAKITPCFENGKGAYLEMP